ncbi:hypothetical protein WJX77_005603 [Trebouxia sp. C0004]
MCSRPEHLDAHLEQLFARAEQAFLSQTVSLATSPIPEPRVTCSMQASGLPNSEPSPQQRPVASPRNAAKRPKPERAADDRPSSSTQVPGAGTRELADSVEPSMQQLSFASPTKRLKVETLSYPAHRSDGQPSGSSQTPEAESTDEVPWEDVQSKTSKAKRRQSSAQSMASQQCQRKCKELDRFFYCKSQVDLIAGGHEECENPVHAKNLIWWLPKNRYAVVQIARGRKCTFVDYNHEMMCTVLYTCDQGHVW